MGADAIPDGHLGHLLELSTQVFDPSRAFAERLVSALERKRQHLGLSHGMVTHIDQEADREEILLTAGSGGALAEGETVPLSEMYCRETVAADAGRLVIECASEEGWADDPAYRRFGLETYVGSVVEFGGDRRGTVCFLDETPREESLPAAEIDLVTLLARWASYELARTTGRAGIEAADDRLASLLDPIETDAVDTALEILAHPIRRELVAYLAGVDDPVSVGDLAGHLAATGGIAGEPRERIEIALVHSHLPKLANAGVVAYDERTRELDYRADDAVERVLASVRPLET